MQELNAEQIDKLLRLNLQDDHQARILAAHAPFIRGKQGEAENAVQLLQQYIREAAQANIPSVLPINTTHQFVDLDTTDAGTHWVLLVIFPNKLALLQPTIYYIDSTGNDLMAASLASQANLIELSQRGPHWISAIASMVGWIENATAGFKPSIWTSGKIQQTPGDSNSCGAWLVQNAVDIIESTASIDQRLNSLRDKLDEKYRQAPRSSLDVVAAAAAAAPIAVITPVSPETTIPVFSDIPLDPNTPFVRLFERVAQDPRYTSLIAVQLYDKQYSYEQIHKAADALAVKLHQQFPVKGTLIGLVLERNQYLIIAMLAIWKAGLAFTPMDPLSAKGVLEFWVKDSEIRAIITEQCPDTLTQIIREQSLTQIMMETPIAAPTADQLVALRAIEVTPKDLAYVMYTSGSTGQPKGVTILHAGLPYCLRAHDAALDSIALQDVVAQFSSITFDAIIIEIMMALARGAKLLMVPLAVRNDTQQLTAYYTQHGVSIAILTPKQLKLLKPEQFSRLRALFIVGESFSQTLSDAWISNRRSVFNGYGLTETTIALTLQKLVKGEKLTIGKVIEGLSILLRRLTAAEEDDRTTEEINPSALTMDDMIPATEIGRHGEIVVFGPSLTSGYWGSRGKALNEKRFFLLDHPIYGRTPAYLSGDIAVRVNQDEYTLQGRLGREIKLRAQRIHPGVIENQILACQHQGVSLVDVVCVVTKKDQHDDTRLVAYVHLNPACDLDEKTALTKLYYFLKGSLPGFAVPAFSHLIPVTAENFMAVEKPGDKKSLDINKVTAQWPWPRQHLVTSVMPQNEIEESLRKIWFELLEIPNETITHLGVNEDFFDLGGDSLKFESLKLALEKAFPNIDWNIWTPAKIGEFTIHSIASYVFEESRNDVLVHLVEGYRPPLYVTHALTGDPSQDYQHFKPLALAAHQPLLGLKPPQLKYMPVTLQELAAAYVKRILRSHPPGTPVHLAGWSTGGIIALEIGKQLRADGCSVNIFVLDSFCPSHFQSFESRPSQLLDELESMKRKFAEILSVILQISYDRVLAKWSALRHETEKGLHHAVKTWFDSAAEALKTLAPSAARDEAIQRLQRIQAIFLLELNYGLSLKSEETPRFHLLSAEETQATYGTSLGWPVSRIERNTVYPGDHFALVSTQDTVRNIFHSIRNQMLGAFHLSVRNTDFTGRIEKLLDLKKAFLHTTRTACKVAVIHGQGGFGKTQLAMEYAHRAENYDQIIWINAEQDLQNTFQELANFYGLKVRDRKYKEAVYAHVRGRVLVVFDNVEDEKNLLPYLPPEQIGGPVFDILVTSRTSLRPHEFAQIPLEEFTEQEAVTFIRKKLPLVGEADAKKLAERLGRLPLALSLAVVAILNDPQLNVMGYLALLDEHFSETTDRYGLITDQYQRTVYSTWWLNLPALRSVEGAENLFYLCAFLMPDQMDIEMLRGLSGLEEETFTAALECLERLSLLIPNQDRRVAQGRTNDRMHRLIAETIEAHLSTTLPFKQRKLFELLMYFKNKIIELAKQGDRVIPGMLAIMGHATRVVHHQLLEKTPDLQQTERFNLLATLGRFQHVVLARHADARDTLSFAIRIANNKSLGLDPSEPQFWLTNTFFGAYDMAAYEAAEALMSDQQKAVALTVIKRNFSEARALMLREFFQIVNRTIQQQQRQYPLLGMAAIFLAGYQQMPSDQVLKQLPRLLPTLLSFLPPDMPIDLEYIADGLGILATTYGFEGKHEEMNAYLEHALKMLEMSKRQLRRQERGEQPWMQVQTLIFFGLSFARKMLGDPVGSYQFLSEGFRRVRAEQGENTDNYLYNQMWLVMRIAQDYQEPAIGRWVVFLFLAINFERIHDLDNAETCATLAVEAKDGANPLVLFERWDFFRRHPERTAPPSTQETLEAALTTQDDIICFSDLDQARLPTEVSEPIPDGAVVSCHVSILYYYLQLQALRADPSQTNMILLESIYAKMMEKASVYKENLISIDPTLIELQQAMQASMSMSS